MPEPDEQPGHRSAAIGRHLRHARRERGLSLIALAQRSGVAKATLTKLEGGRANPTVDTLYALADALGIPLGDLIAPDAAAAGAVRVVRAAETPAVPGTVRARLVDRLYGRGLVELFDVTFGERRRDAEPHPRGVIESLLLVEGALRVGPVEAPVELGPGDLVRFPGDRPHLYLALGGEARAVLAMSHP
jgi:transcriptional regulator with XRE-family HTH domain